MGEMEKEDSGARPALARHWGFNRVRVAGKSQRCQVRHRPALRPAAGLRARKNFLCLDFPVPVCSSWAETCFENWFRWIVWGGVSSLRLPAAEGPKHGRRPTNTRLQPKQEEKPETHRHYQLGRRTSTESTDYQHKRMWHTKKKHVVKTI